MNVVLETVQVQLVNAWWEQVIPLAAILISLFSVGLTLYFRFADRLNLALNASPSTLISTERGWLEGQDRIYVRVTNKSRTMSTQITSLTLQLPDSGTLIYTDMWPDDDELPKTIGPGESVSRSYSAKVVGQTLEQHKPKWIRAHAVSGHKTIKAEKDRPMAKYLRAYAIKHSPSS